MIKRLCIVLLGVLSINAAIGQCNASFTPSQTPICQGQPETFSDFSSGGTGPFTYSWNFGAGAVPATSLLQNPPAVTYTTPGVKTVTLTYTAAGGGGCVSTATQAITVNALPVATFASNAPQCAGSAVNFTNTGSSGPGVTYSWDFGPGAIPATATMENPTGVIYSTSGTKTITFIVNNGYCTTVDTLSIAIKATPIASFTSNAPACTASPVNFTNTGTAAGVTYAWNFGVGAVPAISALQNPAGITYTSAGTKTVTLVVTNPVTGCIAVTSQTINIYQTPTATFTSNAPQCAGSSVNFTNTGTSGAGVTYSWDFGLDATPATSTAENPSGIVYSTSGTKTITFSINNGHCTAVDTLSIAIKSTPTSSFTSNAPQCSGATVNFTNTGSVGANITYSWNFGPNGVPGFSVAPNPSVVFTSGGPQTVTLIVGNSITGCSTTSTQVININQAPTATFVSNAPVCAGSAVNFTNTGTSGAGVTYSWDFGTNASPQTSIAESPSGITYSTPGTKLVTFTVASGSCVAVDTMSIVADTTPVASFTSNAPKCTGDSVTFTNTGSATNVTYNWNFGPNGLPATSTNQNVSGVAFSTSGVQSISLTVTNITSGCSVTTTQTININQTPTATFITNAPQCVGSSVNFTNTGTTGAGITYSWNFGLNANPQTSNTENPMDVVYSSGGMKLITFTVSSATCTMVDTMSIAIDSLPVAAAGRDTTICSSDSVQIGVASVAGYTYSWTPANLVTNAAISNPYAKPSASVTNYILTVTSPSGCVNRDTVVVSLFAPLVANVGPPVSICRLDSVQLGASPIMGQKYSWNPRKGLSDSAIANPKASPDSTTLYTLTVNGNGCTPATNQVTVTVHQLPWNPSVIDTIAMGASVQLTVTGGVEYIWTPSSGLSNPGANDPIASPDSTTKYTVLITDLFGCSVNDTVTVNVIGLNFWAPTAFTPNGDGKDDIFYIHGEIKNFDFGIYNRWGEEIYHSQNINEGWNGRRQVTGEEAPDGAYIYYVKGTLSNGQGISSKGMVNLIR